MFEFLTPPVLVSLLVLYILFVWRISIVIRDYRHSLEEGKLLKIFEIRGGRINTLASLLRELSPPFTFETSVHHIGKEIHSYLIVSGVRTDEIKAKFSEARVVNDYNIYHAGGTNRGIYLKSNQERPILDFRSLDFSKVNEIGESVLIQVVVAKKSGDGRQVNLRIFISAPTPYQVEEIVTSLKPSFSDFRLIASKSDDFLERLNNRIFEEKEAIAWG